VKLFLFSLALGGAVLAQAQTRPAYGGPVANAGQAGKLYVIAGKVTDAVTGEPVARATVALEDEETRQTVETAETGAEGEFALEPVAAGKYPLRVTRRGYRGAYFDEHDSYNSAIVAGEGQETGQIDFRLSPGAVVHGVVTDDAGEPVEQARVVIAQKTREGGLGEHLETVSNEVTDDLGKFEAWNLTPGRYFLAVQAKPWFAIHPPQGAQSSALDVAYPVTYYDGVTDEGAATPIILRSGDRAEVNVALQTVPAIHLMVRDGSGDGSHRMPQISQSILGDSTRGSVGELRPGSTGPGMVEYAGIAPGHYTVTQGNPPRTVELDATGGGGVEVNPAQGAALASVTVKVKMAGNAPLPEPLQLVLRQESGTQRLLRMNTVAEGKEKASANFAAVPPGVWTILAESGNLALAVGSIETNTGARQESRIQVGENPLTLNVTLAVGSTQVKGFAKKDGKGLPGVMIVLVPRDPAANWALFRRDQSDSDGSFALRDVVAGTYTVVAIEDGWELDWARPEVIGRYLSQGLFVTVTEASGKEIRLGKAVAVQGR
jgi:hypothetical protein